MSLRDIEYKPLYIVPRDNYAKDALIPSLKHAQSFDCMFGFFGSSALRSIAPGLSEYLASSSNPMRLVISPNVSPEDFSAFQEGVATPKEIIESRLSELMGEAKVSTSALVKHTLTCLAYMLSTGMLELKVAWLKDGALFHPKVWFFHDGDDCVVLHGSSNFTGSGLARNHEQISVDLSWEEGRSQIVIEELRDEFDALWNGSRDYIYTMPLPAAIEHELIRVYKPDSPPTEKEFKEAWESDFQEIIEIVSSGSNLSQEKSRLQVPDYLNLYEGPFSHQGRAINAWENAGRRGFLSMATGSGKTITALAAATRLLEERGKLLVVVSAPYKPLVAQWVDEVKEFGVTPLPLSGSVAVRAQKLDLAVRSLVSGVSDVEVIVATEHFLTSQNFRAVLDNIPEDISTLLIADEAHNLGVKSFLSNTPERFDCRLGLSATPERQYDPDGTAALFEFFGPPVFEFAMKDAIGVCLVPYNYYMHRVELTEEEYEEWLLLTDRLRKQGFKGDAEASESSGLSELVEKLLFARRRILESAENKVEILRKILRKRTRDDLKHVLVYATDKNPQQLLDVNDLLQNELNLIIHQLTSQETSSRARSATILESFAQGDYNALTCKRVLDEGVDVPQVSEAYILASNTVKRQWIQRRGRVLRRCDAIDKKIAYLHDFIVTPPDPKDRDGRSIIKGELERAREFAELSANAGEIGGPLDQIEKLMSAMFSS